MKKQSNKPTLFLRLGIGLTFLYAGIASVVNPQNWIGFIPPAVENFLPAESFLFLFSLFEIALALWLLLGRATAWAALISAFVLAAIVLPNFGAFELVFRDFGLLFAALALFFLSRRAG